jgi:hypothetical protein
VSALEKGVNTRALGKRIKTMRKQLTIASKLAFWERARLLLFLVKTFSSVLKPSRNL